MSKNLVRKNTAADLRTAYLTAFDNFSTEPVEVGNAVNGNSRYGRELLGTLVAANLVVTNEVNGQEMVWQCWDTYDNVTREQAEATIDAWLAESYKEDAPAAKPAKDPNPAGLATCLCGCGGTVGRGRNYRPGHDARHAGVVGREIAGHTGTGYEGTKAELLATLPTEALRQKALTVAANAGKPRKSRAKKAVAADPVLGTVKVGRWVYPAMRNADGTVVRNSSRHGGGEWVSVAKPETFVAA